MSKNKILYLDYVFSDDDESLRSGNPYAVMSLSGLELENDTLEIEVKCENPEIKKFRINTPLQYFRQEVQKGTYYVQSIERIGADFYVIKADSNVGLLSKMPHAGGVYTGQRAEDVVKEICGAMPVMVKTILADLQVYGWLPYAKPPDRSARDNLAQVLLAIGAHLKTDLNGVLRVEPLWDGTSSEVGMGRIYQGASVEYAAPVSTVAVTEHQYAQGAEERELFQGTAQEGELITFDEPMHSLTASGFTILESGANYAVLSAGVGTLTGKKYIHTTRQIARTVTEGAAENVQSITDATLVSLVNSSAVADQLSDFYRCRETITGGIVAGAERTGDVISVYHPFDKTVVPACIQTLDSAMSAVLKSEMSALVGFLPPQPDDARYITERIILTGEGEFEVPADAGDLIHYVLFSGATGGGAGKEGGRASSSRKSYSIRYQRPIPPYDWRTDTLQVWGGEGGEGGVGGDGGEASRILEGDFAVTPLQKIRYKCGIGGIGAVYGVDVGASGAETTFSSLSTIDGFSAPETGWVDPITGDVYAHRGLTGLPGGNGAGAVPDYSAPDDAGMDDMLRYQTATGAIDEDGTLWSGAETLSTSENIAYYNSSMYTGYALGQGGAAGVTLQIPQNTGTVSSKVITPASGLVGATPTLVPKKAALTMGGRGGYGGGGGSCASWAELDHNSREDGYQLSQGTPGDGGYGGQGGEGGDGMIILYISRGTPIQSGRFVTRDGQDFLDRLDRRVIV